MPKDGDKIGDNPIKLVGLGGLEPPTSRLSGVRSNQLSYRPSFKGAGNIQIYFAYVKIYSRKIEIFMLYSFFLRNGV